MTAIVSVFRGFLGLLAAVALSGAVWLGAQAPAPWAMLERPRTHVPGPTGPDISAADLMTRLYLFADDSMGGRLLDSRGNSLGVEYIARELQRMGLEPAGDSGRYFQTVPVLYRIFDSTSAIAASGTALRPWIDFVPRDQGAGARSIDGVPVVYGGTWGNRASLLAPDSVAGKLVVFTLGPAGYSQGVPGTADRGLLTSVYHGAAGIAVVGLDLVPPQMLGFYQQMGQEFRPNPPAPLPSYLYITNRVAGLLLGVPVDTVHLHAGVVGRPLTGTPRFLDRPLRYPARNVVAILKGGDPALAAEYVAIGAHNDHVGTLDASLPHDSIYILDHLFRQAGEDDREPRLTAAQAVELNAALADIRRRTHGASARPDSIFNGADDDGSGSMGVLEIAQWFASRPVRPKRSLLFVWHVGEEEGLYGSEYFTDHPTVPRDSIVAQLNMDMIGRGGATDVTGNTKEGVRIHGDSNYVQLVGSRRLSDELGTLAEAVNIEGGHGLHFDYSMDANGHPQNIYCRSDHYSYARYGIPIIFFTTGGHADYHELTDEAQYIDYDRMTRVTRFVADLADHLASLDHRPVVDKPKLDPHGNCQQ